MSNKFYKHKIGASHGFWQSYSDMMAALLLVFILLVAVVCSQFLKANDLYEEKLKELAEQQEKLAEQQEKLNQQQVKMKEQEKRLAQQQAIIDDVIGVKATIVNSLIQAFHGSDLKVEIDPQTGTIRLDSSILFEFDSAKLSDEGKQVLKVFLPKYLSVLFDPTNIKYISEIIVEGYTDNDGEYMYNLQLSQKRAYAVSSYWLDTDNHIFEDKYRPDLRQRLTANGKSFSNLIYKSSGGVDKDRSRRVEIKFRLNEDQTIERLKALIKK